MLVLWLESESKWIGMEIFSEVFWFITRIEIEIIIWLENWIPRIELGFDFGRIEPFLFHPKIRIWMELPLTKWLKWESPIPIPGSKSFQPNTLQSYQLICLRKHSFSLKRKSTCANSLSKEVAQPFEFTNSMLQWSNLTAAASRSPLLLFSWNY